LRNKNPHIKNPHVFPFSFCPPSQAAMFVTIAKSSSAMGGSSSASNSKGGGSKGGGKERKESAGVGGVADEETANALALNLFISDTAGM